jgi:hypothetical protein
MNFTLSTFSQRKKIIGNWSDLAQAAVYFKEVSETGITESRSFIAENIEAMMENEASDNDYTKEQIKEMHWSHYTDSAASDIFHVNASFIYVGRKQITSYPKEVYAATVEIAEAECRSYFDKEEYVHPDFTKKKRSVKSHTKVKAKCPGVYPKPTKANPNRWAAYYREDSQTKLIGYFNNEEDAIQAKLTVRTIKLN